MVAWGFPKLLASEGIYFVKYALMKFPETLKVGAIEYKIVVSPDYERWHEWSEEYGHIDFVAREISISTKFADEQKRDSLVHEVVHAIVKHMNLGEDWGDKSEDYVKRFSNGLNMVFKDNPKFVDLLR